MKKARKRKVGSSETTREASVFHFDIVCSSYCTTASEKQKKTEFFEWFVGFTEGDGSFALAKSNTPGVMRPSFQINQKHPQVLYKIKKECGFGRVISVTEKKTNSSYYRFSVYKLEHIQRLISLFNGNLVLNKVQIRFAQWVAAYNDLCDRRQNVLSKQFLKKCSLSSTGLQDSNSLIPQDSLTKTELKAITPQLDLNSAWLAGFTDAEGGFYGSLSFNKGSLSGRTFRERYKFYISQKDELEVLQKLDQLIQRATFEKYSGKTSLEELSKRKHVDRIPGKENSYRWNISRLTNLETLIDYFDRYPLFSKKQLVFVRWKRLLMRRDALRAQALASDKGMRRYKRLFSSIGRIRKLAELSTSQIH